MLQATRRRIHAVCVSPGARALVFVSFYPPGSKVETYKQPRATLLIVAVICKCLLPHGYRCILKYPCTVPVQDYGLGCPHLCILHPTHCPVVLQKQSTIYTWTLVTQDLNIQVCCNLAVVTGHNSPIQLNITSLLCILSHAVYSHHCPIRKL